MRERVVKENSEAALRALKAVEAEALEAPYDVLLEVRIVEAVIAAQSLQGYISRILAQELTHKEAGLLCPCQRCGDE